MIETFSKEFLEEIREYLDSHNIPESALLEILKKHDEKLEEEKINQLENKIKGVVSTMSEKDLKDMIKKVAKNSKQLSYSAETNRKNSIEVVYKDTSGNTVRISFTFEYEEGEVAPYINYSFSYYGPGLDKDTKIYLMRNDPQNHLLKEMDNKTKRELLTGLYSLIKDNKNS